MKNITPHIENRNQQFAMIPEGIVDRMPDMGGTAMLVYIALTWMGGRQKSCYPSIETLSKKTGAGRTAIVTALNRLEELGLIERENRFKDGRKSSNRYIITYAVPVDSDRNPVIASRNPAIVVGRNPAIEPDIYVEPDLSSYEDVDDQNLDDDEQDDGKLLEPPRDFPGPPPMRAIDVHGWWFDHHHLPYPNRPEGKEIAAARRLPEKGFDDPGKLQRLYDWLASDPFYKNKGITLSVMDSRATAYLAVHAGSFASQTKTAEVETKKGPLYWNKQRLERYRRREFDQGEAPRFLQANGEENLAEAIAFLEQWIEEHEDGSATPPE